MRSDYCLLEFISFYGRIGLETNIIFDFVTNGCRQIPIGKLLLNRFLKVLGASSFLRARPP